MMRRGLSGKRVLITRPRHQADGLAQSLADLGAEPVIFPVITIAPLEDNRRVDSAVSAAHAWDWVIFTSANGVSAVWDRIAALALEQPFTGCKIAAIGPATAQALAERGVRADLVPEEYIAEAIAEGLGDVQGQRILMLRADIARESLGQILQQRGAQVENIPVYRTVAAQPDEQMLAELEPGMDIVTLTSASTARSFAQITAGRDWPWLKTVVIACIGPVTADAARACGLPVAVVADEYTAGGLVQALVDYFEKKSSEETA